MLVKAHQGGRWERQSSSKLGDQQLNVAVGGGDGGEFGVSGARRFNVGFVEITHQFRQKREAVVKGGAGGLAGAHSNKRLRREEPQQRVVILELDRRLDRQVGLFVEANEQVALGQLFKQPRQVKQRWQPFKRPLKAVDGALAADSLVGQNIVEAEQVGQPAEGIEVSVVVGDGVVKQLDRGGDEAKQGGTLAARDPQRQRRGAIRQRRQRPTFGQRLRRAQSVALHP